MQIVKGANSLLARFAKRDACRWSADGSALSPVDASGTKMAAERQPAVSGGALPNKRLAAGRSSDGRLGRTVLPLRGHLLGVEGTGRNRKAGDMPKARAASIWPIGIA